MGKYREVMKDERYLNLYVEGAREQFMQKGIAIGEQRGIYWGIAIGEQQGREEGIAIGEQRGRQEGIAIGEQKGKQEGIAIGEQKGKQEGIAIGEQKLREERIKQVQRMAARGMSVPEIADLTDLPMEEVKKIVLNIR